MDGLCRRTVRRVSRLSPGARQDLTRAQTAPSDVRADVIGQFHERAGGVGITEVLIDLESDEMLRIQVINVLRHLLDGAAD